MGGYNRGLRAAVAGSLVFAGALTVPVLGGTLPAGAATPVALYVTMSGSGHTCTKGHPCGSIQAGVDTATGAAYAGDDVTIHVAGGTYAENDTFDASSLDSLTIAGAGASTTTVNGNQAGSVFTIDGTTVTLSGLTIENGLAVQGGGILNEAEFLTLIDSTVSGNTATSDGGGMENDHGATIVDSTISDNSASSDTGLGFGGGIENSGELTIEASTIYGNQADSPDGSGGGLDNNGPLTVTNSTIVGNSATHLGGGIWSNESVVFGATIVGENAASIGPECEGEFNVDLGYNLTDNSDCDFDDVTDAVNADLELGPLADNGGPTQTVLPGPTSPAVGVIPNPTTVNTFPLCPGIDQRGVARPGPVETNCTIGAVEVGTSSRLQITTTSLPIGTVGVPYSFALQATGGNAPYKWGEWGGGRLPRGLSFSSAGVLAGTPRKAGTTSLTFRVRDTKTAFYTPFNKTSALLTVTIFIT
jgi:hypothetical protein